jgi:hypothetical protein
VFTITLENDRLFVSQNGQKPVPLYFTSDTAFFVMEPPAADLEFLSTDGKVDTMQIKQGNGTYKAKKK